MIASKSVSRLLVSLCVALTIGALFAPASQAAFGLVPGSLGGGAFDAEGQAYSQAGGHPDTVNVHFEFNQMETEDGEVVAEGGGVRDIITEAPPGLVGNPLATPRCERDVFLSRGICPASTQVGFTEISGTFFEKLTHFPSPVYNLAAPQGVPAEFGFAVGGAIVLARPSLRADGDYGITFSVTDITQILSLLSVDFTFWGVPADPSHDAERGDFGTGFGVICGLNDKGELINGPPCPSDAPLSPFLVNPTDCAHGPFDTELRVRSWLGEEHSDVFTTQDAGGNPLGVTGCESVPFNPTIKAAPTSKLAENATGLDFELKMPNTGLLNPKGVAETQPKKVEVALPEGVTANPSLAEGLAVCAPDEYAKETAFSAPGAGCPEAAKIGSLSVKTPLLEEIAEGSLYMAKPDDPKTAAKGAENPFDTLIALYMVAKIPERGLIVKLAGKVEPDPKTGQLITTFDNLPQQPFETFKLHFREGGRSPLSTPPVCGTFQTVAKFTPWSAQDKVITRTSEFTIAKGVDGGACPKAGPPPFKPGFSAGTLNNNAASFSPFNLRLTRRDGDQDLTKFSATLPPGVVAKLAGVSQCPEAAIKAAKQKTGLQERENPSCPASSKIGRVLAGAGVGSVLTYVPGQIYLAGPHKGAPISVVAMVPAVAGPFDVGTVVTRQALQIDTQTAEVKVDGTHSDPIPHILAGIPLKVRDIRAYVDRPNFTLNPTSCDPFAVGAELWSGGEDVFSQDDDSPHSLSDRFQAANCQNLGFKPKVSIKLRGGTKRGDFPSLKAVVRPRPGDANIAFAAATLPRSAFLEQGHIRTICTRVQFKANACPKGSIYGKASAFTPLLDEPLTGNVYLRSSDNTLPDVVVALKGPPSLPISFDLVGRVDSVKGAIRNSFETAPDAPVTKFVLTMKGGKKGLVVNSRDLCSAPNRATVRLRAQNAKRRSFRPKVVATGCRGKGSSRRGAR